MATDVTMDCDPVGAAGPRGLSEPELRRVVRSLLSVAGMSGEVDLVELRGGANNRVYRVDVDSRPSLVAKAFFRHDADSRDRLAAEYGFARFAAGRGVRALAQPIAADAASGVALFEFVPGRRLEAGEVDERAVGQALRFFAEVNHHRDDPAAADLPEAAEACFSIYDHLACVDHRVRRLTELAQCTEADEQAAWFARQELSGRWAHVQGRVFERARARGIGVEQELPRAMHCLSPSDFGFHNAILDDRGLLRFIDFEYAGWDDPAKMICDFFCQVRSPVPLSLFDDLADGVTAALRQGDSALKTRARLLLPVYQVKWCCILLNEFLTPGQARRRFAAGTQADGLVRDMAEIEARKQHQLAMARMALGRVAESEAA